MITTGPAPSHYVHTINYEQGMVTGLPRKSEWHQRVTIRRGSFMVIGLRICYREGGEEEE